MHAYPPSLPPPKRFHVIYGGERLIEMLEVSTLGVGMVLRLERDAWSMSQ